VGVVFAVIVLLVIGGLLAVVLIPSLRSRFMPAFAADRAMKMLKARQAADQLNAVEMDKAAKG
jgi:Na+-transporting methylmalonyl-CoA/oxaloacetate decarboxylase gamma subunit